MHSENAPISGVVVRRESLVLPTYLPAVPDRNPMFLDKRVYQGSSGRIYPLPFIDRIAGKAEAVAWDAIHLENAFVELTILPQLGGRIQFGRDKTNGYDFLYRQEVIKPALVGLAGPWISGGVEFNWPQHHRPSTFMPTDVEIEAHADGSQTVWLSEHEPMNRMKGMHGICLHPDKSLIELKVRLYNRAETTQTFLWWANVAARVHAQYQSYFPPDVAFVADHARRAMSGFSLCRGTYYGVDYARRAAGGVPPDEAPSRYVPENGYTADDLSWYANIPVPTSYMCVSTNEGFFGGYDHRVRAGLVHFADPHISPGKKQWTWGNHDFGYAWDRNLTDPTPDGEYPPYIELMAGVYTDNQPDFSFLAPGETKSWSQYWYPIREIGIPRIANPFAAVSLLRGSEGCRLGVAVTEPRVGVQVEVWDRGAREPSSAWTADLSPEAPFQCDFAEAEKEGDSLEVRVFHRGRELIRLGPERHMETIEVPPPASEPALPHEIASVEELYLTGLHLHQYRHATRRPEPYWEEALRRDPGEARCNHAMGLRFLHRGEFARAEAAFRRAVERLTERNSNPYDGEPFYHLGLALRHQGRDEEAYAAFYKSTWNYAWKSAGYFALAEIDCCRKNWNTALEHLERSIRSDADHLKAQNLRAMVLAELSRAKEASLARAEILAFDPLDAWARVLAGKAADLDGQTALDVALDLARSGFFEEASALLAQVRGGDGDPRNRGVQPMLVLARGWLCVKAGAEEAACTLFRGAAQMDPTHCFPARLEEIAILETALKFCPVNAKAWYYLGNLLYDRGRRAEAITHWEHAVSIDPDLATAWRNLGIARFNVLGQRAEALEAYDRAWAANPGDARVGYERDQLRKRLGVSPGERLARLERDLDQVFARDDFSVELCALYNQVGQTDKASRILTTRCFQPWEGGEGRVLEQYFRTCLALGQDCLKRGQAEVAKRHFEAALCPPENLGEAWHLLAM